MDNTKDKPTSMKKRILEPQVESNPKKERKRLKKGKTKSAAESQSEETQIKKITEFKGKGQKID